MTLGYVDWEMTKPSRRLRSISNAAVRFEIELISSDHQSRSEGEGLNMKTTSNVAHNQHSPVRGYHTADLFDHRTRIARADKVILHGPA